MTNLKGRRRGSILTLLPAAILASYAMLTRPDEVQASPPTPIFFRGTIEYVHDGSPFPQDEQLIIFKREGWDPNQGFNYSPADTIWTGINPDGSSIPEGYFNQHVDPELDGEFVRIKWNDDGLHKLVYFGQPGDLHTDHQLSADFTGTTALYVNPQVVAVPESPGESLELRVAPNPSNAQTNISFTLPEGMRARVGIYDLRGRHITDLLDNDFLDQGEHSFPWDGKDAQGNTVASGSYIVNLISEDYQESQKISVVR